MKETFSSPRDKHTVEGLKGKGGFAITHLVRFPRTNRAYHHYNVRIIEVGRGKNYGNRR